MLSVVIGVLSLGGANMTLFDAGLAYQRTVERTLGASPVVRLGCIVEQNKKIDQLQVWT
jgi:hypothetical protein